MTIAQVELDRKLGQTQRFVHDFLDSLEDLPPSEKRGHAKAHFMRGLALLYECYKDEQAAIDKEVAIMRQAFAEG